MKPVNKMNREELVAEINGCELSLRSVRGSFLEKFNLPKSPGRVREMTDLEHEARRLESHIRTCKAHLENVEAKETAVRESAAR